MKKLLLATALFASTVTQAEINSHRWTVNNGGLAIVQEDSAGLQYAAYERCSDVGFITFYDGAQEYRPNLQFNEIKIRVDRMEIHTFKNVEIFEGVNNGFKYHVLTPENLRAEMYKGTTMRVQYNGDVVETYSLIGFTQSVNSTQDLGFCGDDAPEKDYFTDNGTNYFRS